MTAQQSLRLDHASAPALRLHLAAFEALTFRHSESILAVLDVFIVPASRILLPRCLCSTIYFSVSMSDTIGR